MILSINTLLVQTWSRVEQSSVSGLDEEREIVSELSRTGRPGPSGPLSHSLLPGLLGQPQPAQTALGQQSYFVSNRLDTQSELQSVLTDKIPVREKSWICLINQPPRDCPETVSCWQWRHWHCDLLIGKFAPIRILFSSQLRDGYCERN